MDGVFRKIYNRKRNAGSTLVEMIVCFALLAIFISSAAMIIASVTNLYHQVKGETYARQVADILMEKIAAEIEGAKYNSELSFGDNGNPVVVYGRNTDINPTGENVSTVTLYDRTDTLVTIYGDTSAGEVMLYYAPIVRNNYEREGTIWRFDKGVYNQYRVTDLKFVPGDKLPSEYGVNPAEYGVTNNASYDRNIVVVFLTIESPKYGSYHTVRPVKMFYVPEEDVIAP